MWGSQQGPRIPILFVRRRATEKNRNHRGRFGRCWEPSAGDRPAVRPRSFRQIQPGARSPQAQGPRALQPKRCVALTVPGHRSGNVATAPIALPSSDPPFTLQRPPLYPPALETSCVYVSRFLRLGRFPARVCDATFPPIALCSLRSPCSTRKRCALSSASRKRPGRGSIIQPSTPGRWANSDYPPSSSLPPRSRSRDRFVSPVSF